MRRLISVMGVIGMFVLGTVPVKAAPADVFISEVVTGTIDCGPTQYTFISGSWRMVVHVGDTTPSGNSQFSVHGFADNVTVTDQAGALYRVVGQWHFGGTHLANDTTPFHFGMHLQIVGQGGTVDNISAVLTGSPFADLWIDIGSCAPLG
jgi:hypothetical protein